MPWAIQVQQMGQSIRSGFWMKQIEILKDITFTVKTGTVFGLVGSNGAGKTTLIHLLAGICQPKQGSVCIFGESAHSLAAKSRMGYLPERPYFYTHLTGEGLLLYFGQLSGMDAVQIRKRIPEVLEKVHLLDARRLPLKQYSKGMLQRIGIGQALIHQPDLLILDEPMSGLDPRGRKEILDLMKQLVIEGKTIFFSSHILSDIQAICQHAAWIEKGRIIKMGSIDGFFDKEMERLL
jgi:ABC-2 type transport system ATP-binding protein